METGSTEPSWLGCFKLSVQTVQETLAITQYDRFLRIKRIYDTTYNVKMIIHLILDKLHLLSPKIDCEPMSLFANRA